MKGYFEKYKDYLYVATKVLEGGVTSFKDFVYNMIDKCSEDVIPYLKSLYVGIYYYPDLGIITNNMESPETIDKINLEALLEEKENTFRLVEEDYLAINIAQNIVKKLINYPSIKPRDIIAIGNFLYAIDRLPQKTVGVNASIIIGYTNENEQYKESKYYEFSITDDVFQIDISGYVNDRIVGGDSIEYPSWRIEKDGGRDADCDLSTLEEEIDEYLALGATISTEDYSEIEELE